MIFTNSFILSLILYQCTLSLNTNSSLFHEVFSYHTETYNKAEYARQVVDKIYNAFQQWFFTITFCEFTYFENRILKYSENNGYGYPVLLLNGCPDHNRTKVKPRINRHGKTTYLVTSNDLNVEESEFVIAAFQRSGVFKPRSAVVFVIKEFVTIDKYFQFTLRNHFQLLQAKRITNSVLIMKTETLKIFTYNHFTNSIIDITEVKDISALLSHQYRNLHGYKIKLSVFRKVYISDESGPVQCHSVLAATVMNTLNATCVPLKPRDASTVGDLLDNGTATGVTADLIDGYTDLELSSRILKNSYYGYIDTTYPLTQDPLCFVVKNSDKQSTFTTTINLMSMNLLLTFALAFITLNILAVGVRLVENKIWISQDQQTIGELLMDLFKCFLRQTANIIFWGPVFRITIMMVILYSLIVNCVIDGVIFAALSNPRNKPDINNMQDIVNDINLTVGVHSRDQRLFNKSLSEEFYKSLQNRTEILNDQKIKNVIEKRQFQYALLLRRSEGQYISRSPTYSIAGRNIFHVVQECPVPSFIVYGLQYGSPYLLRLNFILNQLNEAGILTHWGVTNKFTLQKKLTASQKDKRPLDIYSLSEVFYVMFIGILISCIVLVLEVIIYKIKNIKK